MAGHVLLLSLLLVTSAPGRAEPPLFDDSQRALEGTWVLNAEQSTFGTGPTWRPQVITITRKGPSMGFYCEGSDRIGRPVSRLALDDGRRHTMKGGNIASEGVEVSLERRPARGFGFTLVKFGRIAAMGLITVTSKDGRTMTMISSGELFGEKYNAALVYARR